MKGKIQVKSSSQITVFLLCAILIVVFYSVEGRADLFWHDNLFCCLNVYVRRKLYISKSKVKPLSFCLSIHIKLLLLLQGVYFSIEEKEVT